MYTSYDYSTYWTPHFVQIEQLLKGKPFWKTVLFSLLCLERQRFAYNRLCIGREWGNEKNITKLFARLYNAITTGYRIGETYRTIIEESMVVATEDWDILAVEFVTSLQILFEVLEKKDKTAAPIFAKRNVEFLDIFLNYETSNYEGLHPLMKKEKAFQLQLANQIANVETSDKLEFIQNCKQNATTSILEDAWFKEYPMYAPCKRKRKKIESDDLCFRTVYQTNTLMTKNSQLVQANVEKIFIWLAQFKKAGYQIPEHLKAEYEQTAYHPAKRLLTSFLEQDYVSFYHQMQFHYAALVKYNYLGENAITKTLQALYQFAQCDCICTRLFNKLSKEQRKKKHAINGRSNSALQALLVYSYDEATSLIEKDTSPYIKFMHKMLLGEYEQVSPFIEQCSKQIDTVYLGTDLIMIKALYAKDAVAIRKSVIKMIKAIRNMEDIYLEILPILPTLVVRCAKQMGISIKTIKVSELLEELTDIKSPFEPESSQPFGVDYLITKGIL